MLQAKPVRSEPKIVLGALGQRKIDQFAGMWVGTESCKAICPGIEAIESIPGRSPQRPIMIPPTVG